MEPINGLPIRQLEKMLKRFEKVTRHLIEAERELERQRNDQYVTWAWACWYLNVDEAKAVRMLADEPLYILDHSIERFLKSDIINFAKRHKIQVKERGDFILRKPPVEKQSSKVSSKKASSIFTSEEDKRYEIEKIMRRIVENRDKAIDRRRAQGKL